MRASDQSTSVVTQTYPLRPDSCDVMIQQL